MWEEHPWYQKQQVRTIGLIVLGVFALYIGYAVVHHDWHLVGQTLLVAASLLLALLLLSETAWLLVKIFTRGDQKEVQPQRDSND